MFLQMNCLNTLSGSIFVVTGLDITINCVDFIINIIHELLIKNVWCAPYPEFRDLETLLHIECLPSEFNIIFGVYIKLYYMQ